MTTIIAIGGAEIGEPLKDGKLKPVVVEDIHAEILARTGKQHPRVLYVPTAKDDSEGYINGFTQYYMGLGCGKVDVLRLVRARPSRKEIEEKIFSADAVYVNGGNTHRMMRIWKKRGVNETLKKAYYKGIVMAGHSAGAICWFSNGDSDSYNKHHPFKVAALGIVNGLLCPHYDTEPIRQKALKKIMKRTSHQVAIALDECAAIEIVDGGYRILAPNNTAKARRTYWKDGRYLVEEIQSIEAFQDLKSLLSKPT